MDVSIIILSREKQFLQKDNTLIFMQHDASSIYNLGPIFLRRYDASSIYTLWVPNFLRQHHQRKIVSAKSYKNLPLKSLVKELSLCHKLRFSNRYFFATQCCRPFILWILMDKITKVWNIKGLHHLVSKI